MIQALESEVQNHTSEIVQVQRGNPSGSKQGGDQGTWIHPLLAIDLAQWANADFALQVAKWVYQILKTGHVDIRPQPAPAPAPSADFARLEAMVLRLVEVVAGITEHIASRPRALPGSSCTVRQMCERTGWQTSTALKRRIWAFPAARVACCVGSVLRTGFAALFVPDARF